MAKGSEKKVRKKPSASKKCSDCESLTETIKVLQETNLALKETVRGLSERLQSVEKTLAEAISVNNSPSAIGTGIETRVKAVEELVEERTNRQLRKTLVIKGVPEDEDEKSWQDCENKLSKIFAETLDIPTEDAKSLIDRCHRGGNKKYYKDIKKTRPIYAAMLHWKTCEQLIWNARKKRNILIDYKYGPLTTKRRNLAMKKRRELLNSGSVIQAHVAYPARLMGRARRDQRYYEIEDFSKADVKFRDE